MLPNVMPPLAGPGPLLAFVPDPDPDALVEAAVALANGDGGTIAIGLGPDGTPTGRALPADLARALDLAAQRCVPALRLDGYECLHWGQDSVITVSVPRSPRVHALHDGRVLVRAAGENRVLDGGEIRALLATKSAGEFEAEAVPGTSPRDLDPELLAAYMVKRAERLGEPIGSDDALAIHAGAVTPDYRVTVAGMLLFGREPQHWLPQSRARFARWVGRDGTRILAAEQEFGGAAVPLVEQLWSAIEAQMRTPAGDGDTLPDYPAAAVREALVNAVCHRDYRLRGQGIEVRMYWDHLEITSPGGLPGFITAAHLQDGRFCRNLRLARALHQWGYLEEPGAGVRQMAGAMEQHGCRLPQYEARPYQVTVRLYSRRASAHPSPAHTAPSAADGSLNARQIAALDYVRQHGSINLRELRTLYSSVRADLLQQDLSRLVEQGRLRKMGSRASSYYILP